MTVDKSSDRVRRMFGEIAGRYDLLNRVLSLGMDRRWRRRTARLVPPEGDAPILDLCTGTADLALAYWRAGGGQTPVVGADFCHPMLVLGRDKLRRAGAEGQVRLVEADAQQLPFPDDCFQIVSRGVWAAKRERHGSGAAGNGPGVPTGGKGGRAGVLDAPRGATPGSVSLVLSSGSPSRGAIAGKEPAVGLQLPPCQRGGIPTR